MSRLIVSMCEAYDHCQEHLQMLLQNLDVFPLAANAKVLLKVNSGIGGDNTSLQGTNTILVKNLITILRQYGSTVYVGDSSPVYGYTGQIFQSSGLELAVKEAGGIIVNFDELPGKVVHLLGVRVLVPKLLGEMDFIITVPKLKLNTISGFSGALKNQMGYIQGSGKSRIHQRLIRKGDFYAAICALNQLHPPDLAIMDAIEAMEGNGPSSGTKKVLNILAASRDLLCMDTFFNEYYCRSDDAGQLLAIAAHAGLGVNHLHDMEICGDWKADHLQRGISLARFVETNPILGRILYRIREKGVRIQVDHTKCRQCLQCIQWCPVEAIQIMDGLVAIQHRSCLGCFGCLQQCPAHAMRLEPSFLFKTLFRGKVTRFNKEGER